LEGAVGGDAELEHHCTTLRHLVDYRRSANRRSSAGRAASSIATTSTGSTGSGAHPAPDRQPAPDAVDSAGGRAPPTATGPAVSTATAKFRRPPDPVISIQQLRKFELDALVEQGKADALVANLKAGLHGGNSRAASERAVT